MTITYFLMLFFVFWTLWLLSSFFNNTGYIADKYQRFGVSIGRLLWAALGTYFFHNIW